MLGVYSSWAWAPNCFTDRRCLRLAPTQPIFIMHTRHRSNYASCGYFFDEDDSTPSSPTMGQFAGPLAVEESLTRTSSMSISREFLTPALVLVLAYVGSGKTRLDGGSREPMEALRAYLLGRQHELTGSEAFGDSSRAGGSSIWCSPRRHSPQRYRTRRGIYRPNRFRGPRYSPIGGAWAPHKTRSTATAHARVPMGQAGHELGDAHRPGGCRRTQLRQTRATTR